MHKEQIERLRRETPSCANIIHFNNAGASPMPLPVSESVISHIRRECEVGGYLAAAEARADIEDFYPAFAALLNCDPSEIAYCENATRAWDMAFYAQPFQPGERIITCTSEYASNYLAFLHMAKMRGIIIDVAPNDESGQISPTGLEELIQPETRLIAINHVPTQGGLVNPAKEIGVIARARSVRYLLDACQSVGQLPVDVQAIGCDFLSGTGRKFLRGPRGTGFLWVNRDLLADLHPPFVDLHAATWVAEDEYELRSDARRFENWESNVAGRIGLGCAVRYALDIGLDEIARRISSLAGRLRRNLAVIPGVEVADLGQTRCGIVTASIRDRDPQSISRDLLAAGITSSVSSADSARLDFDSRGIEKLLRLSVHYFNTEAEVDRACNTLEDILCR